MVHQWSEKSPYVRGLPKRLPKIAAGTLATFPGDDTVRWVDHGRIFCWSYGLPIGSLEEA